MQQMLYYELNERMLKNGFFCGRYITIVFAPRQHWNQKINYDDDCGWLCNSFKNICFYISQIQSHVRFFPSVFINLKWRKRGLYLIQKNNLLTLRLIKH